MPPGASMAEQPEVTRKRPRVDLRYSPRPEDSPCVASDSVVGVCRSACTAFLTSPSAQTSTVGPGAAACARRVILRGRHQQGPLQQRLDRLRGLRAGRRRQLPLGRAGGHREDPRADEEADPLRLRHAPSRRPRLRQPGVGGRRRHAGRAHRRARGDEAARDRPVRRSARALGGRRRRSARTCAARS